MSRKPIKEINAEFFAEERYLGSIQQIAREACVSSGMAKKMTTAVLLAIEEGASNIIRHAYLYEKGSIRLRIVIYPKLIAFSLIDAGRSFQPQGSHRLDLEKLVESGRRGGLGFYMIQKIMDSVEYVSSSGYNELRMIKRLDSYDEAHPPFLRRLNTLRFKFSLYTFVIVGVIVGSAYYYVNDRTTRGLYERLDNTVRALGTTAAQQAAGYILNARSDVEFDDLAVAYLRPNPDIKRLILTDTTGLIIAHSQDIRLIRKPYVPPVSAHTKLVGEPQRLTLSQDGESYLTLPITTGERRLGAVHIVYSAAGIQEQLAEARSRILTLIAGLTIVGLVGIYLLSNFFVDPIVRISQRVRRFSSGDLTTELPLEGTDEFFEISSALNEMMTRISRDRKATIERERLNREIELTSQIQKTLMPATLPVIANLDIYAFYRAAEIVGGDLYDVFELQQARYCFVVADVSGKGLPASLVMSMLRTSLRIYASVCSGPRETLIRVNEYLSSNLPPNMFITALLAFYDSNDRSLSFVSAGHNPLIYFNAAESKLKKLNPSGMPLGVPVNLERGFEQRLTEMTITLSENDLFFAYSDGITDALNKDSQQYGVERLSTFLKQRICVSLELKAQDLSDLLVSELDNHIGFSKPSDDVTFIMARAKASTDMSSSHAAASPSAVELRRTPDAGVA